MAAGGADVAGNDFCHYGLGCQEVSDKEAAAIRQEQRAEELNDFKSQSMFARMFDTSSSYSLVSRLAMAVPGSSMTSISQSVASTLANPTSLLSGLRGGSSVSAAASDEDPMGITQYAYPRDTDKIFTDDPQATWDRLKCDDPATLSEWGKKSTTNPDTGMEEHSEANPCQLIQASVGMACGIYSDDCLTDEDLNGTNPAGAEGSLSVMTYNLRKCSLENDCGNAGKRMDLAANAIKQANADIVTTQETEPEQLKALLKNGTMAQYDYADLSTKDIFWRKSKFSKVGNGSFEIPKSKRYRP